MADLMGNRVADRSRHESIDFGTRQWAPADDLESARMGLQRRLDEQRARRTVEHQVGRAGESVRPAPSPASVSRPHAARTQISLSYAELLRILAQAAINQQGVTLTRTADNVYLKLEDGAEAPATGQDVSAVIALELAVRDRLEAVVARRYLDLHGPDYVVDNEFAPLSEEQVIERIRA